MGASTILDAIAAVHIGVAGLNDDAIYSAGGGEIAGVKDLPDNLADGAFPAVVVLDAGKSIIPGSWERTTLTVESTVWVPDVPPRGEAYRNLMDLEDAIREAFRTRARASVADPEVQAVLITEVGRVAGRQWMRGDNQPWFLVLPFTLQVTVNRAVAYRPS